MPLCTPVPVAVWPHGPPVDQVAEFVAWTIAVSKTNLDGQSGPPPFHNALLRYCQAGSRFGTVAGALRWTADPTCGAYSDRPPCVMIRPRHGAVVGGWMCTCCLLAPRLYTGLILRPHTGQPRCLSRALPSLSHPSPLPPQLAASLHSFRTRHGRACVHR